jgi:ribonuclease HI
MKKIDELNFYTDGAYSPVTKTGGWAVYCPELKLRITNQEKDTTNNRMELIAAINAMKFILQTGMKISTVNIYSDSLYVINTLKGLYKKTKTNLDLWSKAFRVLYLIQQQSIQINWIHIKGHAGHINNEIVDRLANLLSQTKLK